LGRLARFGLAGVGQRLHWRRIHHSGVVRRHHTHPLCDGEIIAKVDLPIDLPSLVEVVPNVREV